jgi:predicted ATPase
MAAGEQHLTSALADRILLLVLDNLEHLLEGVPLLSRLLSAAPALRILATSRIALRLSGEHIVRVPSLSLPGDNPAAPPQDSEAFRLFAARAGAVSPGFADQPGDVPAIAEICTCLDGLPLAIELAAARVRLWPPQVLLPMLQSRLQPLTGGPRDQPARQQTLRAALDWSYKLLTEPAKELFRRLGVFAGPFNAAAAAAVTAAGDAEDILARLAELADQSLLEITPGATPLFRLLQTGVRVRVRPAGRSRRAGRCAAPSPGVLPPAGRGCAQALPGRPEDPRAAGHLADRAAEHRGGSGLRRPAGRRGQREPG